MIPLGVGNNASSGYYGYGFERFTASTEMFRLCYSSDIVKLAGTSILMLALGAVAPADVLSL